MLVVVVAAVAAVFVVVSTDGGCYDRCLFVVSRATPAVASPLQPTGH